MEIILQVIMLLIVMLGLIFLSSLMTKDEDDDISRVIPEDKTWEDRYYSLVVAVWISTPEESREDFSYDEWHKETLDEIKEMNSVIHEKRMKDV